MKTENCRNIVIYTKILLKILSGETHANCNMAKSVINEVPISSTTDDIVNGINYIVKQEVSYSN